MDLLGHFTSILLKNFKNLKEAPLVQSKNFRKQSLMVPKKVKSTKFAEVGILSKFLRFDVSSMFWTSVVQVEQMNKTMDKKVTHFKSRAVFFRSVE